MLTRFSDRSVIGFSIIELMVAITVGAILMMAAAPSIQSWIFNTRVRTSAEALQNGLRQAQAEAVRRSRIVVIDFRNAADTLATTGIVRWSSATVPWLIVPSTGTLEASEAVKSGRIAEAAGVVIAGATGTTSRLCFNSIGALAGVNAPVAATVATEPAATFAAGAAVCSAPSANSTMTFSVSHPNADRALNVLVTNSGRVRMCDPARAIATSPDGC